MAAMGTDNWHLDWLEEQSIHVCALMELMCHSIFQFFYILVVLDPVIIASRLCWAELSDANGTDTAAHGGDVW